MRSRHDSESHANGRGGASVSPAAHARVPALRPLRRRASPPPPTDRSSLLYSAPSTRPPPWATRPRNASKYACVALSLATSLRVAGVSGPNPKARRGEKVSNISPQATSRACHSLRTPRSPPSRTWRPRGRRTRRRRARGEARRFREAAATIRRRVGLASLPRRPSWTCRVVQEAGPVGVEAEVYAARLWDWVRETRRGKRPGRTGSRRARGRSRRASCDESRRTSGRCPRRLARRWGGHESRGRLRPSAAVALAFEAASEAVDVRLTNHAVVVPVVVGDLAHSSSDSNSTGSLTKAYALELTLTPLSRRRAGGSRPPGSCPRRARGGHEHHARHHLDQRRGGATFHST